jgi:hypothetical protein
MLNCEEKWGSVRKVRYFDDIETSINYSLRYEGTRFSDKIFTSEMIRRREERHNLIQKHYRRSIIRTKKSMYETKFKVTLPDTLTFLKEMKILWIEDGIVVPLDLAKEFEAASSEKEKRVLVLKYVLNSKYRAYRLFLRQLNKTKQFVIPNDYSKRDENFGAFLKRAGFFTDVASFYTIRDLFYELDAINWYIDEDDNLILYPVFSMNGRESCLWTEQIESEDFVLHLNRKVKKELFLKELVETYLNSTGRRFMINADLVEVRDKLCSKYLLGDFHFKELLLEYSGNRDIPYKIQLNFGSMKTRKRNYDLKIMSLPKLSSNRLALYITIEEAQPWSNGQSTF